MMNMADTIEPESTPSDTIDPRYISDTIKVRAIPEKRGTFLKYTEYEITSEKYKSKVERRYSDFSTLHSYLLQKYTNRMIPRPPPKQLMLDSFIEERRRGLQRWLKLISHHPLVSSDEILKIFLTNSSGDHLQQMQNAFNSDSDEYLKLSNNVRFSITDLSQLISSRELMRTRLNQVVKIKRLFEQQAKREIAQSRDFLELSTTVNAISEDFKDVSENFSEIAKESEKVSKNQQLAVAERFLLIVDILTAHSDLCERVERNLDSEMHRNNLGEAYENELKRRKSFALFCVAEESKFAQKYLQLLPSIVLQFSFEESKGFSNIYESLKKIVNKESDKIDNGEESEKK